MNLCFWPYGQEGKRVKFAVSCTERTPVHVNLESSFNVFQTQNKDKHSQYGATELATELTHSPLPCGGVYTTCAPETSVRQTYLQNGTKRTKKTGD